MVTVFSVEDLVKLIHQHGLETFFNDLILQLKKDFTRWQEFNKMPRPAFHCNDGVIELMPIADETLFSFKYVNGHPKNPLNHKQTVIAIGQLAAISDGYPLFISEMTLLTALRTAATAALASDLLARKEAKTIAIIGTGAQSEFQIIAHTLVRDITCVRYYDSDAKAMKKFSQQMANYVPTLIACENSEQAVAKSDIIIVCTAAKKHARILNDSWITPGMHINALGGDCPGKTELMLATLEKAKIVVEFIDQAAVEGEIQHYGDLSKNQVHAELWQLLRGERSGRENAEEITIFDAVGFALEDFSALCLTYQLAQKYQLGHQLSMVPSLDDPKNLFAVLNA